MSLEPQVDDEDVSRAWIEEAERRLTEWRDGKVQALDAQVVTKEARQAISVPLTRN